MFSSSHTFPPCFPTAQAANVTRTHVGLRPRRCVWHPVSMDVGPITGCGENDGTRDHGLDKCVCRLQRRHTNSCARAFVGPSPDAFLQLVPLQRSLGRVTIPPGCTATTTGALPGLFTATVPDTFLRTSGHHIRDIPAVFDPERHWACHCTVGAPPALFPKRYRASHCTRCTPASLEPNRHRA